MESTGHENHTERMNMAQQGGVFINEEHSPDPGLSVVKLLDAQSKQVGKNLKT